MFVSLVIIHHFYSYPVQNANIKIWRLYCYPMHFVESTLYVKKKPNCPILNMGSKIRSPQGHIIRPMFTYRLFTLRLLQTSRDLWQNWNFCFWIKIQVRCHERNQIMTWNNSEVKVNNTIRITSTFIKKDWATIT